MQMEYGYTIAERYICRKPLGNGGNGSVFLCFDQKINTFWAVKACNKLSKNEIYALKSINHYAFPRIVDVIFQDNTEFLVMDYIDGETLSSYCRHNSVEEKQILRWGFKIASALSYLHELSPAVYFVDCKPDNILITPSGDVRIVDFGSIYVDSDIKDDFAVTGTRFYAPDELSNGIPNASTDIYCLGMTLYRLLTGSSVEYRNSRGLLCPEHINKNISVPSCELIKKCTHKNPLKRYQSMGDVSKRLHELSLAKHTTNFRKPNWMGHIAKLIVATAILVLAATLNSSSFGIILILFAFLLYLCRKPVYYSRETKKFVYKSSIAVISSIIILLTIPCFESSAKKDVPLSERLDITLYDKYSRKLLIRPGAVWDVNDDIRFSLPIDELSEELNTITITCETSSGIKSYSFNCRYNTSDN